MIRRRSTPWRSRAAVCPTAAGPQGHVVYGGRVKIALMDSGIGLLAAAAAVRRLRPDADLVLSCDPDGMPWGPATRRTSPRARWPCAEAAAAHRPDALIVACNTASVHALPALRARLEPELPVIGTVPAIKPAASGGGPVAIWATPATTGSPYQRGLIAEFADGVQVTEVPCPGLADAVEHADETAIDAVAAAAAALTHRGVRPSSWAAPTTNWSPSASVRPSSVPVRRRSSCTARPVRWPPRPCAGSAPGPRPEAAPSTLLTVLLSGREAPCRHAALSLRGRPAAPDGQPARLTAAARPESHRPEQSLSATGSRMAKLSNLVGMRDHPHGEHPRTTPRSGPAAPTNRVQWLLALGGAAMPGARHRTGRRLGLDLGRRPAGMSVVGCIAAGLLVLFGTLAFVHVAVQGRQDCLEVRCGHIGVPRRRIPLGARRRRRVRPARSPRASGAAGGTAGAPRRAPPSSYAAARAWCSTRGRATFTVTVDDAEAAVRVIRDRLRLSPGGTPSGA